MPTPDKPTRRPHSRNGPHHDREGDTGPAVSDQPDPPAALSVAAVARRLGVAPATLRTWHQRYGIGPVAHATGTRRRYQPSDVARLDLMATLTRAGVNPADAARAALAGQVDAPDTPSTADGPAPAAGGRKSSHGGGGRVVALPSGSASTRGLARAAMALDATTVGTIVRRAVHEHGVVWTWEQVLTPVLIAIGEHWSATGTGVDAEHLLSECIIGALYSGTGAAPRPRTRPVLLACAAEEAHSLPLHAVAAAMAEVGVPTRLLGARVPVDALVSACRRLGPPAVVVWAHTSRTAQVAQLRALPVLRPRPVVLAAGPGWPDHLPSRVERVESLAEAVQLLAQAVGPVRVLGPGRSTR